MLFQGEVFLCGMTSFTGFQFMALREGEKIPNHRRLGYKGSFRASFVFSFYRRGGLQGPHFAGPQLSDFPNTTETDSLTAETRGNPQPLPAFLVFPRTGRTERRECSEMSVMLVSPFLLTPWLPWTVILHVLAFSVLYRPTKMSVPCSFWLYLSAMKMDKVAALTEFVAKVFSQNHCPLSCPVTLG